MNRKTGGFYGVNEALFASALACMVFSVLGAQPLTVVGITGLISLFNYTIFDIVKRYDASIYPQVMVWVAIWTAIFHWIFAFCNTCDYMRFVTDFSSESFGAYVGIIYCSRSEGQFHRITADSFAVKGVELLIGVFQSHGPVQGYASVVIALLFFFTVYVLEMIPRGIWLTPSIRKFLGDYAYPVQQMTYRADIVTNGATACDHLLDRLRAFSRPVESGECIQASTYESILSYGRSRLADQFLGLGGEMGLYFLTDWILDDAALLL